MKLIFTLLLFCYSLCAFSQVMTSSCVPTPQMVNIYRNDVIKTATRRLFETNSTYKDSIEIPILVKDSIARVMYAIHNMPPSALRDTILNLYGHQNFSMAGGIYTYDFDSVHIHNNGYSYSSSIAGNFTNSPKGLDMYIADTTTWVQQWHVGNYTNTNNPAINALALQYGITLTSYYPIPQFGRIHITTTTNRAINIFALNTAFNSIIGNTPQTSYVLNYVGDGNSIELVYQTGGIQITYLNKCGDCPSGCNWGRSWTFKVFYGTCSVQYLGAQNYGTGTNPVDPNASVYTCTRGPVLPLTFGTLTGYLQSGKSALTWKVLTQVNVKEYVIERSDDGSQFYPADKVTATTASSAEYNWKDVQVLKGTAWYRIKAVDVDGKQKYSFVIKLSNAKGGGITIYPNPVQNHQFTVQFATPISGKVQTCLYDISGKQVWNTTIGVTPQTSSRTFVLPSNLPSGTYSIVIQSETINYRQTLVIGSK